MVSVLLYLFWISASIFVLDQYFYICLESVLLYLSWISTILLGDHACFMAYVILIMCYE